MSHHNIPSNIELTAPNFPYLIVDEAGDTQSFVTIRLADQFNQDRDLFYIFGGHLTHSSENRMSESLVTLRHSTALDDDSDAVHLAKFAIDGLHLEGAYGKTLRFVGWMTSAAFYPSDYVNSNGEHLDPFKDFVPSEEPNAPESTGFPYVPPTVDFGMTPVKVEVSIRYGYDDSILEQVRSAVEKEREQKRITKENEAAFLKEQDEKAARRQAEHKEWLKTPEGKKELAVRAFINSLKRVGGTTETLSDEERVTIETAARDHLDALSDDHREAVKAAIAERSWFVAANKVGMRAYLAAAEGHLGL